MEKDTLHKMPCEHLRMVIKDDLTDELPDDVKLLKVMLTVPLRSISAERRSSCSTDVPAHRTSLEPHFIHKLMRRATLCDNTMADTNQSSSGRMMVTTVTRLQLARRTDSLFLSSVSQKMHTASYVGQKYISDIIDCIYNTDRLRYVPLQEKEADMKGAGLTACTGTSRQRRLGIPSSFSIHVYGLLVSSCVCMRAFPSSVRLFSSCF